MSEGRIDACDARGAEQELAVARVAEQQGDVKHAAFHVAAALFDDPTSFDAKAMALRLDEKQPGVFGAGGFAGEVAAAALVAVARGDVATGLTLTAQVAEVLPDLPWQTWLHEQIARAVATNVPVPATALARLGFGLGKHTLGLLHLGPAKARAYARYADVLFAATAAPNGGDAMLCSAASSLARRAGQLDRAVALAERAHQSEPNNSNPLIMMALALRARGDVDAAAVAFARAAAVNGDPNGYAADRARCFFDAGRMQEALDLLETLPDKDTDLELRLTRAVCLTRGAVRRAAGDTVDVDAALRGLAQDAARFLGDRPIDCDAIRRLVLGHGMAFGIAEATVNAARQLPRSVVPTEVSISVTSMEAPSSRLALALHTGYGCAAKVDLKNERVPTPDPRTVDDDGFSVWRFFETAPFPALPDPAPAVHARVDAIAGDDEVVWLPRWRARAVACADLDVDVLCACFNNIPMPPIDVDAIDAVVRRQLAVACALSVTAAGRARLLALLGGPVDWVTVAAVSALVEAVVDGDIEADVVARRLRLLVETRVHDGHCCLVGPLPSLVSRVPFVRPDTLAKLASDPST